MGLALSSIGVGTLVGPPLGGVLFEHWGMRAPFLVAAAFVGLGLASSPWSASIALAVAAAGSLILAPTLTLIGVVADAQQPPAYGAAYALYNLAYAAGLTVAPLLGGVATGALGFGGAALVGAVVLAVGGGGAALVGRQSARVALPTSPLQQESN